MPSIMPLLSYPAPAQDDDGSASTSPTSRGNVDDSLRSSTRVVQNDAPKEMGKYAESRTRSGSSSKPGKKSGKKKRRQAGLVAPGNESPTSNGASGKATAHAQAVQAVKKAVLEVQLLLLGGVKEKAQLGSASSLLTQSEYADVVTERSISKQCGYPLCKKELPTEQTRKGRYRISLHEHKVYDLRETRLFCSAICLVASKTYQSSLQIERDDLMKKDKLIAIIRSICGLGASNLSQNETRMISHQIKSKSVMSNESLLSGVEERHDITISSFDDAGPYDAVEGYIPRNSIRESRPNKTAEQSGDAIRDTLQCGADIERIASGNEAALGVGLSSKEFPLDKGKSPVILDDMEKVESSPALVLKSALKKSKTQSLLKRSVSWKDQMKKDSKPEKKERKSSARLKERPKAGTYASQTATQTTAHLSSSRLLSISTGGSLSGGYVSGSSRADSTGTAEVRTNSAKPAPNFENLRPPRVVAAEALAAALTEAAEATVGGEIGSEEAVAMAGLSIVPATETSGNSVPLLPSSEGPIDALEKHGSCTSTTVAVDSRWPQLEQGEEDDVNATTTRGSWHDAPPRNFKVEVSKFGTIWMALEDWISAATIAHIYGKESEDQDEFVVANGREFRRQVVDQEGKSAEISRTVSICISQVFPDVVQALRLNTPVSTLEQAIGRLVRTMTFVEALPTFDLEDWRMIVILLLDSLSVQRLPSIGVHLANNMPLLRRLLGTNGTSEAEYDTFRGLLLPLGRLPTFSTMCGG